MFFITKNISQRRPLCQYIFSRIIDSNTDEENIFVYLFHKIKYNYFQDMKIINKKAAILYAVVIGAFALTFVASVIYQLNQPYTGKPYIMQEGE